MRCRGIIAVEGSILICVPVPLALSVHPSTCKLLTDVVRFLHNIHTYPSRFLLIPTLPPCIAGPGLHCLTHTTASSPDASPWVCGAVRGGGVECSLDGSYHRRVAFCRSMEPVQRHRGPLCRRLRASGGPPLSFPQSLR